MHCIYNLILTSQTNNQVKLSKCLYNTDRPMKCTNKLVTLLFFGHSQTMYKHNGASRVLLKYATFNISSQRTCFNNSIVLIPTQPRSN